jgi:predicted lactoylglutathione lyase
VGVGSRAEPETGDGGIRFAIIISMDSPEEVDELADRVRRAGGIMTKEPVDAEFFVGRDAYFADPEGNYWEIAWASADNPVTAAARRAPGIM